MKHQTYKPNWKKSVQGKDFYQRVSEWMYNKERKIEFMKYQQEMQEIQQVQDLLNRR